MIGFVSFLSISVSMALIWLIAVLSYVMRTSLFDRPVWEVVFLLMGLFLPFILIFMAVAFVYIALEIKKNQLIFKDWIRSMRKDFVSYEESVHSMIGRQLEEEIRDPDTYELPFPKEDAPEEKSVFQILKEEPISKYKDLELPDDIDLHFVDKDKA